MISLFRFSWRAVALIVWILFGLFSVGLVFPVLRPGGRRVMVLLMSRLLMRICGVRVIAHGQAVQDRAVLYVSNHVSWLDIFVINSVRCTSFIAKSDIRRWPVIGWLVAGAGTVFIERGQRRAIQIVSQQMATCFERGDAVGLFPEGTTSTGLDVRPFHASLFEAAIALNVDIQPMALVFEHAGQRTERFAFVGEQSLVANIWVLLSARKVSVHCHFLELIPAQSCTEWGRSQTAQQAREQVRAIVCPEELAVEV
ncbi:lysophospholipid acyltransferase family protein [Alcaligenes faecalis subsp. parafaecalis]|uniref:Lysophospholipid acyltransferase family protein n=1 Tax=Alcaligenes parafaecalis TaxID=171260 RepID=A0ABT3VLX2_9BURK|nr:lysophospholipid acyltransferase family protein [Alcaligenes parafaecalis]MCX5464385.1 lysophospholipid acyltransferase family protein [Alcaligenes parafaecalis]